MARDFEAPPQDQQESSAHLPAGDLSRGVERFPVVGGIGIDHLGPGLSSLTLPSLLPSTPLSQKLDLWDIDPRWQLARHSPCAVGLIGHVVSHALWPASADKAVSGSSDMASMQSKLLCIHLVHTWDANYSALPRKVADSSCCHVMTYL